MSEFSNLTGKFRLHTNASQKNAPARVTKRPRDSLVCNQCRISKLRCDRRQPCENCIKRDDRACCTYQKPSASRNGPDRHTAAEDRLLHLESMVKQLMQNQSSVHSANANIPQEPPQDSIEGVKELQLEQVDSLTYVGSTHWSSVLEDIQELKVVLGSSQTPQQAERPAPPEEPLLQGEIIFGSSSHYNLEEIIFYMPPRIEVDRFVSVYFRGETFIVLFVHTYHFQRQYRDFWVDPTSVNPLWLSMLFSVCHMASMIMDTTGSHTSSQKYLGRGHSMLHAAAGKCLVLGEYHRPQIFALEALAMYGHCKNLTSLDPSREVGAILSMVIRMAYEMGYHRDPDSFGTFTVFEGEMRRRFWALCKQFDLMISFMLGLPSNICLANCDTKPPRNLLDSDFDEETKELPASRPENEATKLLWFIIKDRQMVSFSKVCEDALSFKEKSEAEVVQLDLEIRQMYSLTPQVLRTRPLAESIVDPPFLIMTRIYIEFIYLKSLCALHRKYMARGNAFSTKACVEAGKCLVSQFIDMYNEFPPGGQLHIESWMLSNFTMNDFLLGVMVLCLVVYIRRKRGSEHSLIDPSTESEVLWLLEKSCAICVEKSTASRDARRVSHAIRLTLNGVKSLDTARSPVSQASQIVLQAGSDGPNRTGEIFGDDTTSLPNPWNGYALGSEAAFGLLDPFNFMNNDIENINWTIFETELPGQDTASEFDTQQLGVP